MQRLRLGSTEKLIISSTEAENNEQRGSLTLSISLSDSEGERQAVHERQAVSEKAVTEDL